MFLYYNHCVAATNNVHTMGRTKGKENSCWKLTYFINMLFV